MLTFSDERDKRNQNGFDNEIENADNSEEGDGSDSVNEIVIKVGGDEIDEETEKGIFRQPSTTEYLSGMVHTLSPVGKRFSMIELPVGI